MRAAYFNFLRTSATDYFFTTKYTKSTKGFFDRINKIYRIFFIRK